ncbi:hypothetical protein C8Q76DRAFT_693409 [Earliella scabrosa]|nr:hypothetical protein C8Q76DRAFT_693409 [Earliella scabrosa]
MAPTQSKLLANPSSYTFSATVRRERDHPAVIECVAPSPSRRVRGAELTATRLFKTKANGVKRAKQASVVEPLAGTSGQRSCTPGPSSQPRPSQTAEASSTALSRGLQRGNFDESSLSSISSASSPPSSPLIPPAIIRARSPEQLQVSKRPPAVRLTRAASRGALKSSTKVFRRASMAAIERRLDPNGAILTRYGEQDGEAIFIRDKRVTSTTEPDIVTHFWESFTAIPLPEPPNLSSYPDLTVGDLYCNHVRGAAPSIQLWLWSVAVDGTGYWKKAREGDVREDGRRLTITPKRQQPSWVSADWGIKQLRNPKGR